MSHPNEPLTPNKLIGRILATREKEHGYRKQIMCGVNETEEHRAMPCVLPYAIHGQEKALLRAAALTAKWKDIDQSKQPTPLGQTFLRTSKVTGESQIRPDNPDRIARYLSMLEYMDLDEATATFDQLLGFVQAAHLPFDFFGLARLLAHRGNGVSPASINTRRAPMRSYWLNA